MFAHLQFDIPVVISTFLIIFIIIRQELVQCFTSKTVMFYVWAGWGKGVKEELSFYAQCTYIFNVISAIHLHSESESLLPLVEIEHRVDF